ncbi:heavy metal-associated domain, HMA containing protein, partial [Tanacetum coccineum]
KCSDCYKKVKKVICKIPEIRDQEYDFDKNKVRITVVCCSPERVRDKLSYKGGKSIQKIEIVADKPKASSAAADDDKPKPKPKPKESDKPKGDNDKPKAAEAPPKGDTAPKTEVAKMMFEPPVDGYPQMYPPMTAYPTVGYGYHQQQQQGYGGSPFQHSGYGMPVASSSGYGYGCAYNNHHGYNGNATHNSSNNYFSEDNPQECSIM